MAVLSVCWLIPMALWSFKLYFVAFNTKTKTCTSAFLTNWYTSVISFVTCLVRIITVIIIFTLSVLTIRRLSKHRTIQAHLNKTKRNMLAKRTRAAVTMVLASLLLYVCCWFPRFVFYFLKALQKLLFKRNLIISRSARCIDWSSMHFMVDRLLPTLNSFFSPFIYILFLSDLREAAKRILYRRRNHQRDTTQEIRLTPIQETPRHKDSTQVIRI